MIDVLPRRGELLALLTRRPAAALRPTRPRIAAAVVLAASLALLAGSPRLAEAGGAPASRPGAMQTASRLLQRTSARACDLGRRACRALSPSNLRQLPHRAVAGARRLGHGVVNGSKQVWAWSKQHPRQAMGIALGAAAMLGVVLYAAPAISAGVAQLLTPIVGETTASILGTATGGAVASGSRSLLVHATPMVSGVDPFNARQLATDVGLSSAFGFGGFAQAAALKALGGSLGAAGFGLFALNLGGLVGYEVGKDYLQNRIRNRWASDPKDFRDIAAGSLKMELASNTHRCIPPAWLAAVGIPGADLSTSFIAKIAGDIGGTIWWDRLINKRNPTTGGRPTEEKRHLGAALTE